MKITATECLQVAQLYAHKSNWAFSQISRHRGCNKFARYAGKDFYAKCTEHMAPMARKPHGPETRAKIAAKLTGNKNGNGTRSDKTCLNISSGLKGNTNCLGKIWTNSHKQKIGAANAIKSRGNKNALGHIVSDSAKAKMSAKLVGKRHSKATKAKMALTRRKLLAESGMPLSVDRGATSYFNRLNASAGLHIIHPSVYFKELGYFADGYDPVTHTWYEYDTPSHTKTNIRVRDAKRQAEIIAHFESVGKPLMAFYRINAMGRGPIEMKNVL